MSSKVVVTGGAGFIGSHLVEALIRDHVVTVLDNFSTGMLSNLSRVHKHRNLRLVSGDIRNFSTVQDTIRHSQVVFHLAARVSVPLSIQDPSLTNDVNVAGTLNVLQASINNKVKKLVFSSSCSVYGDSSALYMTEKARPMPISPYGASKLAAEDYCVAFCRTYGLQTVSLRYFNVYGPRQGSGQYAGVISSFVSRVNAGKPPVVFGDGRQARDFTFVSDALNANLLAMETHDVDGEVVNIGTGMATSVKDLAKAVTQLCGKNGLKIAYKPRRPGDILRSCADIRKARRVLGYQPSVKLKEGLTRVINWTLGTTGSSSDNARLSIGLLELQDRVRTMPNQRTCNSPMKALSKTLD